MHVKSKAATARSENIGRENEATGIFSPEQFLRTNTNNTCYCTSNKKPGPTYVIWKGDASKIEIKICLFNS